MEIVKLVSGKSYLLRQFGRLQVAVVGVRFFVCGCSFSGEFSSGESN